MIFSNIKEEWRKMCKNNGCSGVDILEENGFKAWSVKQLSRYKQEQTSPIEEYTILYMLMF